jgi:hypothetical protein
MAFLKLGITIPTDELHDFSEGEVYHQLDYNTILLFKIAMENPL